MYGLIKNSLMAQILPIELNTYINRRCCTTIPVMMRTFLHTDTPSYPVGVFNINGVFLGIADDKDEYVVLWNSDVDNQAQGLLETTSNSLQFKLPNTASIDEVTGLRYWQIQLDSDTGNIFLSDDNYVELPDGSIVKSESYPLGVATTEFNMSNKTTSPSQIAIINSTFRKVLIPQAGNVRIFHNEVGEYATTQATALWSNNYGYLPPTIKSISFHRIAQDLDANNLSPNNYLNYVAATQNIELFQLNGSNITWLSSYIDHMSKLKAFHYFRNGASTASLPFTDFNLGATKHPLLKQIVIRYNIHPSLGTVAVLDFSSLAPLSWGIDLSGAQVDSSADLDNIIIGLASSMSTPAAANTNIKVLTQQAYSRTAASDVAKTYLESIGYIVI